jgi:hypothetical protein
MSLDGFREEWNLVPGLWETGVSLLIPGAAMQKKLNLKLNSVKVSGPCTGDPIEYLDDYFEQPGISPLYALCSWYTNPMENCIT